MDEVTLYNLYGSASASGNRAKIEANEYALSLMVEHLRYEHKMSKVGIHRRLKVPMKTIKEILDGIED